MRSLRQFGAIFVKRAILTKRSLVLNLVQMIIPILLVIIAILAANNIGNAEQSPALKLTLEDYGAQSMVYGRPKNDPAGTILFRWKLNQLFVFLAYRPPIFCRASRCVFVRLSFRLQNSASDYVFEYHRQNFDKCIKRRRLSAGQSNRKFEALQ